MLPSESCVGLNKFKKKEKTLRTMTELFIKGKSMDFGVSFPICKMARWLLDWNNSSQAYVFLSL